VSGLKTSRIVWTVVFLGVTLVAIVMEVVAGIFHPAGTIPWTEYIAQYVPWPVQLIAYVALAVWLPFHFYRHDHLRKAAYRAGKIAALSEPRGADVARMFHEAYEELAPAYGYKTREASAKPWEDVPEQNRRLMIATAITVLNRLGDNGG
jgi:putative Ca2+/H+ antiporter (TMEM165/GDT1 family)